MTDVAIIGAGPYGLSIAAHLKARGIRFRIFGKAMHAWLAHMPKGMHLKSEGFASGLYDPDSTFTLAKYCQREGIPYADVGIPTPLEVFSSYGLEFQKRFVPELEDKSVVSVARSSSGFRICLEEGETAVARRTVIATGLSGFEQVPPILAALGEQWVTHSSRYGNLDHFKGKEVIVIGAGSSALELAALLHQVGACVHLVARAPIVEFHDPPGAAPFVKANPFAIHRPRPGKVAIGLLHRRAAIIPAYAALVSSKAGPGSYQTGSRLVRKRSGGRQGALSSRDAHFAGGGSGRSSKA